MPTEGLISGFAFRYGSRIASTDASRSVRENRSHPPPKPASAVCTCGIFMCLDKALIVSRYP